jgi:hypothetical protein
LKDLWTPSVTAVLLGAFAKLRKATISFVLPVQRELLDSYWTDFSDILYVGIFRKYVEKIRVSFKPLRSNR